MQKKVKKSELTFDLYISDGCSDCSIFLLKSHMEEEEACEINRLYEDSNEELLGWIDIIDFKKGVYCRM